MLATTSRRRVTLGRAAGLATALGTLELTSRLAWVPERPPIADRAPVPDIQFDIERYVPPARLVDGIDVRFGPTHTVFATARLARTPTRRDQRTFAAALAMIEASYPWHPSGVITHVAYGRPYFDRLPPGLVALQMPRLLGDTNRFVLEDATDAGVCAEHNDLLFTLRGDDPLVLADTLAWLGGSDQLAGRPAASPRFEAGLAFTSSRALFVQVGLPRKVAAAGRLPYQLLIHPRSPRWMGLLDDQGELAAPAPAVTCQGAEGVRLTTARAGDYFDNAAIQHLSHHILDLQQFYDVDDDGNPRDDARYLDRVRDAYRSAPAPEPVLARHVDLAQRAARAAEGRPLHQRLDGPGFDSMDVPDASLQPKLQLSMLVPTADLFQRIRDELAVLDGLERFVTATRLQNFLVPPRRHRAFPLLELA